MEYILSTSYAGEALLSSFNWFDGIDPSHGFVSYQNRQNAQSMGLYNIDERTGVVRLGVDSTHSYSITDRGRPSIRIESRETYDHGLFIADFLHMPPSHCGLWPAFWTYGDNWPFDGEIDIIEGVNTAHTNIISAHTADGCSQSSDINGLYSGEQINTQCSVGTDNIGCGFHPSDEDTSSYGDGFNAANGGVYAMEWDSVHIRIWHFARGSIPRDIEIKKPSPDTWGQPIAIFGGSDCKVDSYFKHMRLVLNINFCGDYGDAVWGKTDQCSDFAPTCSEYVAENPEAFANAYWDVQYIDAYELRPDISKPRPSWNSSRPGPLEDERTTTITKTTRWTETVTVLATGHNSHVPHFGDVPAATSAAIEPVTTRAPVNPIKINHYSYLGCFYSNSGFQTFHEVANNTDMTLERCVGLCNNKTYVGIFDSHCFCADSLDADTLATKKEGLCNKVCPGNHFEFCGGIITSRDIDAPREKFVSETLPLHALTVYGCVGEEEPEAPPAMAPGSNGTAVKPEKQFSKTVTKITEVTVFPISEQDAYRNGDHDGDKYEDGKHDGDYKGGDHKDEKDDGHQDKDEEYDGEKHDGDNKGDWHDQYKDEGHSWHNHGGDWYGWNNHEGDGHEAGWHESDGKESAFSIPTTEEDKWKQAKPAISEIVVPVTKTVIDCPESITTKEAIVTPTWVPPIESKPWAPSAPAPPPPPPPHDGGDNHPHDPPSPPPPPPSHGGNNNSHQLPPPLPPTSPEVPVTGPPVVLVAAASTMYGGLEKYLAILGLSMLVLAMRIL
ncbi:glycoside hydrolase family 16 protein [Trichoderma chlorosporum]